MRGGGNILNMSAPNAPDNVFRKKNITKKLSDSEVNIKVKCGGQWSLFD